jgi:hypothetical protein
MRTVKSRRGEWLLWWMVAFCWISSTIAFTGGVPFHKLKSFMSILHFAHSDFDGMIGDDNEAGHALALEFTREVQLRQAQQAERRLLSEEELRFLNRKPFARREEFIAGQVKEIGQTSAGFFSGRGQSVYSFPMDDSPRRRNTRSNNDENTAMMGGSISPLFIPTMAVILLLSVYLTFGEGDVGISANQVEDWNAVQGATTVEQVMPSSSPSVFL